MENGSVPKLARNIAIQRQEKDKKCFFDLPPEIRLEIYNDYFDDLETSQHISTLKHVDESATEVVEASSHHNDNGSMQALTKAKCNVNILDADYNAKVFNVLDERGPRIHANRREIVINQAGYLHANLPILSLVCKALFAETWSHNYDEDASVVIHLQSMDINMILERRNVFKLLSKLCSVDITEGRTILVLHGQSKETEKFSLDTSTKSIRNLKQWLLRHWMDGTPLFDSRVEYMSRNLYKNNPRRETAKDFSACLRVVRYSRLLYQYNFRAWKHSVGAFAGAVEQIELSYRKIRKLDRKGLQAIDEPITTAEIEHSRLVDRLIRAVVCCARAVDFESAREDPYLGNTHTQLQFETRVYYDIVRRKLRSSIGEEEVANLEKARRLNTLH
ncbi:hypothetical protein BDV96DRAFT_601174 [Lophiotrema nucula]|uniref:Uncharacterized protein n=1 Tax=Lophiotrema nucula TaxID=690887 RepID=A0A6A5Z3Q1_9PLEO|nr:hypothetical protein BDV96DRAFT_601174 [Lophiotrema nucula]